MLTFTHTYSSLSFYVIYNHWWFGCTIQQQIYAAYHSMHLLVVRLNDSAIDLCCMRHLLHAFIGGSVNRAPGWPIGRPIAKSSRLAYRSEHIHVVA